MTATPSRPGLLRHRPFALLVLLVSLILAACQQKAVDFAVTPQALCLDPLQGIAGATDDALYRLTVPSELRAAGGVVIVRLPGLEYADNVVSPPPLVRTTYNGRPLRTRLRTVAECPTPSRSKYDLWVHLPDRWSPEQPIDIAIVGYRLPLRAVDALPVEFYLAGQSGKQPTSFASFAGAVSAGPAVAVLLDGPSILHVVEALRLRASCVDRYGNPAAPPADELFIEIDGERPPLPPPRFAPDGTAVIEIPPFDFGVHRVSLIHGTTEIGRSNPILSVGIDPIFSPLWGDLHSHTGYSDAYTTARTADALRYARHTAHLDFAAVTDHAEPVWGCAMSPADWEAISAAVESANEPQKFTAFAGFEWTASFPFAKWWSANDGHAHVLFPRGGAPCRADTEACNTFTKLLDATKPHNALVVRHHTCAAWAPVTFPTTAHPLIPILEIASSHGSCECPTCPGLMPDRMDAAEHFTQAALLTGVRYGLVANSDNHHARPGARRFHGQQHQALDAGGLTCVRALFNRRDEIIDALRERRCYATTSARILLDFAIGDTPMGGERPRGLPADIRYRVHGTDRLEEIVVWRGDLEAKTFTIAHRQTTDALDAIGSWTDPTPPAKGLYYLRARQRDGEMAWSSPIWTER